MSCPNPQVRRSQRKKCWDRISNLPDCVLSRILSLLPTKDAVRTNVLSKDWEYKWTSICNIDINDEDQFLKKKKNKSTMTSFVKFVDRMLFLTEDVKSFHLECWEEHGASRMTAWILSALKCNLRSLRVVSLEAGIIMPGKLLNCNFLENLMLWLPCILNVPKRVYFGSLTSLCLHGVNIVNEASNDDSVMFEFPVLVELTLSRCKWLNMKCVEIHTPRMTSFECETRFHTILNDYSIKITGGSIEKLQSRGGFPEHIVLSSGSSVVSAALENFCEREDFNLLGENRLQIKELLRELSNVEDLKLSSVFLHAIALSKLVGHSLPRFNNLEELAIEGNARAFFELLHAAPFLKRLKLNLRYFADFNHDTEECVPSCLQSHLEEVSIRCSLERRTELDLVKYFLENGAKLKELDISAGRLYSISKDEVAKEISTVSKASKCVTVSFSDWIFV